MESFRYVVQDKVRNDPLLDMIVMCLEHGLQPPASVAGIRS